MPNLSFTIATDAFDATLLPKTARPVEVGSLRFREAVSDYLAAQFKDFGGAVNIRVTPETIFVEWNAESAPDRPLPGG